LVHHSIIILYSLSSLTLGAVSDSLLILSTSVTSSRSQTSSAVPGPSSLLNDGQPSGEIGISGYRCTLSRAAHRYHIGIPPKSPYATGVNGRCLP
jgi:hypothetical protein